MRIDEINEEAMKYFFLVQVMVLETFRNVTAANNFYDMLISLGALLRFYIYRLSIVILIILRCHRCCIKAVFGCVLLHLEFLAFVDFFCYFNYPLICGYG